jgi:hypothetical protein
MVVRCANERSCGQRRVPCSICFCSLGVTVNVAAAFCGGRCGRLPANSSSMERIWTRSNVSKSHLNVLALPDEFGRILAKQMLAGGARGGVQRACRVDQRPRPRPRRRHYRGSRPAAAADRHSRARKSPDVHRRRPGMAVRSRCHEGRQGDDRRAPGRVHRSWPLSLQPSPRWCFADVSSINAAIVQGGRKLARPKNLRIAEAGFSATGTPGDYPPSQPQPVRVLEVAPSPSVELDTCPHPIHRPDRCLGLLERLRHHVDWGRRARSPVEHGPQRQGVADAP